MRLQIRSIPVSAGVVVLSLLAIAAQTRGADGPEPAAVDDFKVLADAIALEAVGKPKEAAAGIARHTFDPSNDAAAAALRGRMIEEAGDDGAAETVYEEALKRHPDNALLHLRAGVLTLAQGDLYAAMFKLERSWAGTRTAEAAYYLGAICAGFGPARADQARAFFVQAVLLDGKQGNWRARATKALAR